MVRVLNPAVGKVERRFLRWVNRTTIDGITGDCWTWTGSRTPRRQPLFKVDGRTVNAGRWYYELKVGPVGPGMQVYRTCHVSMCVRPEHGEPRRRGSRIPRPK